MLSLPLPTPGSRLSVSGLHGSSGALAIAALARRRRPLAVFTSQALDGQRLAQELPFFEPSLRVNLFPDWETLPYDNFSPHQDLVSERLPPPHHTPPPPSPVLFLRAAPPPPT